MFSQYILCIHELLEAIVLDQDIIFKGYFWTSLFSRLGTKLKFNNEEHFETDGVICHYLSSHIIHKSIQRLSFTCLN